MDWGFDIYTLFGLFDFVGRKKTEVMLAAFFWLSLLAALNLCWNKWKKGKWELS
tara:strand:+ start:301 stop:462 length:162 start_codon:yes stop_codon:yes gene_type:complete